MARIAFPTTFVQQQILLQKIIAKHNADGSASVLTIYLTEQEIDLNDEEAAGAEAALNNKALFQMKRQKENERELRDKDFDAAFLHLKQAVQFMKALYGKDFKAIGAWGVHVLNTKRVKLPTKYIERAEAWKLFYKKYKTVPAVDSPLAAFLSANEIDLDVDNAKVQSANLHHQKFSKLSGEAEHERELRDLHWVPVVENMRGIGQFLMSLFETNPQKVSDWGFVVVKAAAVAKRQKSRLLPGAKMKLKGIVLGSVFTNLGAGELHLYKGVKKDTTPVVVLPNKEFGIVKGYSVLTVVNPSKVERGIFLTSRQV